MSKLEGKVAVVTGASYGVGRAIAIGLAREGCDLVLVARTREQLEVTKQRVEQEGHRALVCVTDIMQLDAIQALAATVDREFGRLDILVNCAFGHVGEDEGLSLLDVTPQELADFGMTSIVGTWRVTQALVPALQRSGGRMVFVVADWAWPQHNVFLSTTASAPTKMGSEAFVSAKAAIMGFANALERILQVPTTGIYPGIIASSRGNGSYFDIDDSLEEVQNEYGNWAIPLRDIVSAVVFALNLDSVAKAILIKPSTPDYDGLGIE